MSDVAVPSRTEAIGLLRTDRARTIELLGRLGPGDMERTGLGGGEWTPKDLVGHLESCQQQALDAVAAWDRGEVSQIVTALRTIGTDEVNRREVERKAWMSAEALVASAATTHERLLGALEALGDVRWDATTPEPDDGDTVGGMVGDILGGTEGLFRHDADHWRDLETFPQG